MNRKHRRKRTAMLAFRRGLTALLSIVLTICICAASAPVTAEAAFLEWPLWTLDEEEDASEHAQAAIVVNAETGAILYESDAYSAYYPASITKIMTALLALENCSLDEVVTFSYDSVYNTEGSSIARDVGEEMTLEECLYGMMLASANECAYAIGEHVAGGSIDDFVDMMNEKAAELGCVNTHFANSSGLPDEDHYVSAYDMALIAKAAWENEDFRTIVGTSYYEIEPTNKHDEITYLTNHHNMLCAYTTTKYVRDYCLGGKTGYTEAAGSTLVTYAEQDGMTLICVVLSDTAPNHWLDTISLLEYYFEKCESVTVSVESGLEELFFETQMSALQEDASFLELSADTLEVILPAGADPEDVTCSIVIDDADDMSAVVEVLYNGVSVGSVPITQTDFTVNDWEAVVAMAGSAIEEEEKTGAEALLADAASVAEEMIVLATLALLALLVTVGVKLQQRRERRNEAAGREKPKKMSRREKRRARRKEKQEKKQKKKQEKKRKRSR